ncbi:hypothetical protein HaLaN_01731 [Haematococcus lacustris]|uniref:Uncharacterized protein n=1 Tax=Haematococcus lacustris TaxID=44745 RepID=A0A699YGH6_HAELA|nr:hypothetical protein HaLaN_01731 [Haematococcus lacustris]
MKLGKQRGATKARPPGHASVPTHARVAAKGAIQSERKRSETIEDAHYRKALQRMECGPDDGNLSDSSNDTSEHTQPPSKAVASRRPAKGTAVQEPQTHENSIDSDHEGGLGQQVAARRRRAVPSSIPGAQPVRTYHHIMLIAQWQGMSAAQQTASNTCNSTEVRHCKPTL